MLQNLYVDVKLFLLILIKKMLGVSNGAPGQSRTADNRFRKPVLYPSELPGRRLDVRGFGADDVAEFFQGPSLDLAHAFAGDLEFLSGFVEGMDFPVF